MAFDGWDWNEDGKEDYDDYEFYHELVDTDYLDDFDENRDDDDEYGAHDYDDEYEDDDDDCSGACYGAFYFDPSKYKNMTAEEIEELGEQRRREQEEIRRKDRRFLIGVSFAVVIFGLAIGTMGLGIVGTIIILVWFLYFIPNYWH